MQRRGPFTIHAEFALDSHSRVLASLEKLPSEFRDVLKLDVSRRPIDVYVLANRRRYREYVRARVPGGERRRALFVNGPDRCVVFVYRHEDWAIDLRHECTHALVHNALPYLPLWLDEGLAEYFERPISQKILRSTAHPHLKRIKWSLRLFGWRPSLSRLESRRDFQSMTASDYRDSWAWVHFLLTGPPEARRALSSYLAAIQDNRPPGPFSRFLAARMPNATRALKAHISRQGQ